MMDLRVKNAIESLHPTHLRLVESLPVTDLRSIPKKGVYLFTEASKHLYVGRSNNLPERFKAHHGDTSLANKAAFAMLLARKETGIETSYRPETSRAMLMLDPKFRPAFDRAKKRISQMEFRAVEELDQIRQALFEIYAAVALETPYNNFWTH